MQQRYAGKWARSTEYLLRCVLLGLMHQKRTEAIHGRRRRRKKKKKVKTKTDHPWNPVPRQPLFGVQARSLCELFFSLILPASAFPCPSVLCWLLFRLGSRQWRRRSSWLTHSTTIRQGDQWPGTGCWGQNDGGDGLGWFWDGGRMMTLMNDDDVRGGGHHQVLRTAKPDWPVVFQLTHPVLAVHSRYLLSSRSRTSPFPSGKATHKGCGNADSSRATANKSTMRGVFLPQEVAHRIQMHNIIDATS
jgi:hypothetical protein